MTTQSAGKTAAPWRDQIIYRTFALLPALLLLGSASEASATLTYSTLQTAFEFLNPTLFLEDFEDGSVAPATFSLFTGPLNSATDNIPFDPGDILPGIEFNARPSAGLALVGAGAVGVNLTNWLGIRPLASVASVSSLGPEFTAIGMDFLSSPSAGTTSADVFDIFVFGSGGVLLDVTSVAVGALGSFWGVTTDMGSIFGVVISSRANNFELIDNVRFAPVPEPSAVTTFVLGLGVVGSAIRRRARS